jgi:hypothetical protein
MKSVMELPKITIIPQTEKELYFFQEMLSKMKASFVVSKTNESLLVRFEKGLKEAQKMKEGKTPKKPLRELYENG